MNGVFQYILPFLFTVRGIGAFLPFVLLVMSAKEHLEAGVFELMRLSVKGLDAGAESVEEGYIAR